MKYRSAFVLSGVFFLCVGCNRTVEKHSLDFGLTCKAVGRDATCSKGIDAYSNTVFPLIRKSCLPCHETGGMANRPFATSDVQTSYQSVLRYQEFNAIVTSYFVVKGGAMVPTVTPQDLETSVREWWDNGQKDCTSIGNFVTKANPAPQTPEALVIRFSLSDLAPQIGNASFAVSVRLEENAYVIEKPRVINPDSAIHLAGVGVLLNGRPEQSANGWNSIEASLPRGPKGGALLSACTLRIPVENGEKDVISFSFDTLEKREPFACKNLSLFQKNVLPVLQERSCFRCHSGGVGHEIGEEKAKKMLDMDINDETLCLALLSRGSGKNSVDSPLIALPLRGMLGHPRAIPLSSEVLPSWTDWIQSEGVH